MAAAEVVDLAPAKGDEVPDLPSIGKQLKAVLEQQTTLIRRVEENSTHVLRLHQMHDPLTWRKRATILFAGSFCGTGTVALLMHFAFHVAAR